MSVLNYLLQYILIFTLLNYFKYKTQNKKLEKAKKCVEAFQLFLIIMPIFFITYSVCMYMYISVSVMLLFIFLWFIYLQVNCSGFEDWKMYVFLFSFAPFPL